MANWTICEHSVNRFLNCSRVVVGQEGRRLRLPNEGWPNLKPTANVLSGLILQLPYTPHTCKMAAFNDNFAIFLKKASNERLRSVRGARGAPSRFYCSVDSTTQWILLLSRFYYPASHTVSFSGLKPQIPFPVATALSISLNGGLTQDFFLDTAPV